MVDAVPESLDLAVARDYACSDCVYDPALLVKGTDDAGDLTVVGLGRLCEPLHDPAQIVHFLFVSVGAFTPRVDFLFGRHRFSSFNAHNAFRCALAVAVWPLNLQ